MRNYIIVAALILACLSIATKVYAEIYEISDDPTSESSYIEYSHTLSDPFEKYNRNIFMLNKKVDTCVTQHFILLYKGLLPGPWLQQRIKNFFNNLNEPQYVINSILQRNARNVFVALFRFVVNSTLGLFGVFDIAGEKGIRSKPLTFGSTLYKWKGQPGPYLILPFLGPATARSTAGFIVDFITDPINMLIPVKYVYARLGMELILIKIEYSAIADDIATMALDEYTMTRSLYSQAQIEEK
ncbi:phospholipid-binding lipoprotein MlaA [Alphaproteobacteria bacterium]